MRTSNLNELIKTVEAICLEKYPDIPKELIAEIVQIEFEYQDERNVASEKVAALITNYVNEKRA